MPALYIGGCHIVFIHDDKSRAAGYLGESDKYYFPDEWKQRQGQFMRMEDQIICSCHYSTKVDEVIPSNTLMHGKLNLIPVSVTLDKLIQDGEIINTIELGERFWRAVNPYYDS
jgi:hypothetical protein